MLGTRLQARQPRPDLVQRTLQEADAEPSTAIDLIDPPRGLHQEAVTVQRRGPLPHSAVKWL